MRYATVFLFLIFTAVTGFSQSSDYIGFELGKNFFHYKEIDTGEGLQKDPGAYNLSYGLQYLRSLNKKIVFESGLIYTIYYQQYSTRLYLGAYNEIYKIILVPIRINYSIPILRDRVEFHLFAGY